MKKSVIPPVIVGAAISSAVVAIGYIASNHHNTKKNNIKQIDSNNIKQQIGTNDEPVEENEIFSGVMDTIIDISKIVGATDHTSEIIDPMFLDIMSETEVESNISDEVNKVMLNDDIEYFESEYMKEEVKIDDEKLYEFFSGSNLSINNLIDDKKDDNDEFIFTNLDESNVVDSIDTIEERNVDNIEIDVHINEVNNMQNELDNLVNEVNNIQNELDNLVNEENKIQNELDKLTNEESNIHNVISESKVVESNDVSPLDFIENFLEENNDSEHTLKIDDNEFTINMSEFSNFDADAFIIEDDIDEMNLDGE